jgi:hypothetical protein
MLKKMMMWTTLCTGVLLYSFSFSQTQAAEETPVSMKLVLQKIQEKGYSGINTIEWRKGVYEMIGSDAHSQRVSIIFNPKTNVVTVKPVKPLLTMIEAADRIEKRGYHTIYILKFDQGKYKVDALDKNNKKVALDVDAKTGLISLQVAL